MANENCPIPNNINPLSPTGFKLSITKIPEVTYFCQEANLPELGLESVDIGTPFSVSAVPGEMLRFGELSVNFIVDEEMKNYKAIHTWLVGLGFPEDYLQYQALVNSQQTSTNLPLPGALPVPKFGDMLGNYSDGVLEILGSSNTAVQTIRFVDLHPVNLGTLNFQANATDVNYLIGSATFKYTYYSFVEPVTI